MLIDSFRYSNLKRYFSIWFHFKSDLIENFGFSSTANQCISNPILSPDELEHRIYVNKFFIQYEMYPQTIWEGLSKIGGLIAIFQISFFLNYFHKKVYELSLQQKLVEEIEAGSSSREVEINVKNYKERYSIENFSLMAD
jgi:hypothetical protein